MNWLIFFLALAQIESGNNPEKINGDAVGLYQIKPVFVEDANRIHFRSNRFANEDRLNMDTSQVMIIIVLTHYALVEGLDDPSEYYRCFRFGYKGMYEPENVEHPDIKRFINLYNAEWTPNRYEP